LVAAQPALSERGYAGTPSLQRLKNVGVG
jgi:hypothetical protein